MRVVAERPVARQVEIAPNVRVTVLRATIGSVLKPPEPANDTKA